MENLRHRHTEHDHHHHANNEDHHDVEDPKTHTPLSSPPNAATTRTRKRPTHQSDRQRRKQLDAVEYVKWFIVGVMAVSTLGGGFMLYHLVVYPRFVHPKVVVLPKDFQVSVVLMNHHRPRMIKESSLLSTLLDHPHVGEVLLCHSNPQTRFSYSHPKVKNLDAVAENTERGLALRFYFCYTAASHEYVIIVDDDQEVTPAAINTLLQTFAAHPDRIVGRYGRTYSPYWDHRNHGYNTRTVFGNVEVVLTKFLVAPRDYCGNFLRYESLVQDLLPQSHPLWNGEDIFFSLVANHVNRVPVEGPYRSQAVFFGGVSEASNDYKDDDAGVHDVSGNMDRHVWYRAMWTHDTWGNYTMAVQRARNHTAYRGTLWGTTRQRLAKLSAQEEQHLAQQFARKYSATDNKESPFSQDI